VHEGVRTNITMFGDVAKRLLELLLRAAVAKKSDVM
jgi:hypothetical protein